MPAPSKTQSFKRARGTPGTCMHSKGPEQGLRTHTTVRESAVSAPYHHHDHNVPSIHFLPGISKASSLGFPASVSLEHLLKIQILES